MGHLTLLLGCMFAQKTTELLRRIRRYKAIDYKVLVVNYIGDTRYGTNKVASHDYDSCDAICVTRLDEVESQVQGYQVVAIDEAQFYPDLYDTVRRWTDELPIHVVVAGLSGDSDRAPFGDVLKLVPLAEETEMLTAFCAICKDGTPAPFSKCVRSKETQVEIGGAETYLPVCREHYRA